MTYLELKERLRVHYSSVKRRFGHPLFSEQSSLSVSLEVGIRKIPKLVFLDDYEVFVDKDSKKWIVQSHERNLITFHKAFETESDACEYFFSWITGLFPASFFMQGQRVRGINRQCIKGKREESDFEEFSDRAFSVIHAACNDRGLSYEPSAKHWLVSRINGYSVYLSSFRLNSFPDGFLAESSLYLSHPEIDRIMLELAKQCKETVELPYPVMKRGTSTFFLENDYLPYVLRLEDDIHILESKINGLLDLVEKTAIPFYERNASLGLLIQYEEARIKEWPDWLGAAPALYLINGEKEKGIECLQRMIDLEYVKSRKDIKYLESYKQYRYSPAFEIR